MSIDECPQVMAVRAAYLERIRVHKVYLASLRRLLFSNLPSEEKVKEIYTWYERFAASLTDCVPIQLDLY